MRTLSDYFEFEYFDLATFHVESEVSRPKNASIPSPYGLSDNVPHT